MSRKLASWARFMSWSGSSAQARCDITSVGPAVMTTSRTAIHSAGSMPSRFIPVSSWIPKRAPGSASKCRVSCSTEFSIGTSRMSWIMSVSPAIWPANRLISGSGPISFRRAAPSSAETTKNVAPGPQEGRGRCGRNPACRLLPASPPRLSWVADTASSAHEERVAEVDGKDRAGLWTGFWRGSGAACRRCEASRSGRDGLVSRRRRPHVDGEVLHFKSLGWEISFQDLLTDESNRRWGLTQGVGMAG